jgi:N-acetylneuraminic acid mutarotase
MKRSKNLVRATSPTGRFLVVLSFSAIVSFVDPSAVAEGPSGKGLETKGSSEPKTNPIKRIARLDLEGTQSGSNLTLSLADRVTYQYAIEEVYWRHRIWPRGGGKDGQAKPPLDRVMSAAQIQRKVEDYLRNSNLLADYWQSPITGAQLQAEMERMVSQTKQSEVLQELFSALNNDPRLIAECLARPVLAERLSRSFYAREARIHGDLKNRVESELRAHPTVDEMKQTSGVYSEVEWNKSDSSQNPLNNASRLMRMDADEWQANIGNLASQFEHQPNRTRNALDSHSISGVTAKSLLARIESGVLGRLQEDDSHYYVNAVPEKSEAHLKLATIAWSKEPFESWASRVGVGKRNTVMEPIVRYVLPEINGSSTSCFADSWLGTNRTPEARYYHTAIWTGSEMIVWGGVASSLHAPLNTGAKYSPATDSWVPTSVIGAPDPRSSHTSVWTGSEMIVWAGRVFDGTNDFDVNTGGRYNPITDSWVSTSIIGAPYPRSGHTAIWTGSEMIVWGSIGNNGGRYNPVTDSWVWTSKSGAPDQRFNSTSVWTGTEMIVWGGAFYDGQNVINVNTGGRYNPTTDSWVSTNLSGAPAPRDFHTAVWTGTEMIVWGGIGAFDLVVNTGGRYNPTTDTWVPTSINAAPESRIYHTGVWTGSEMIIWGGTTGSLEPYLKSGGRYNPTTNSWVATSINGAPASDSPEAVWTGNGMIVWGGHTKDGGRYNPITDSWLPTNVDAPTARHYHTAVWTGNEMIVWGGYDGAFLNSGGRYDPATNNWIASSTNGAPDPRFDHTAVWTGTEMIVWGGYGNSAAYLDSGGRYNPDTNSWSTTTMVAAPAQRYAHTAVWSGNEMIVWGGFGGSLGRLNTGGRYSPDENSWIETSTSSAPSAREYQTAVWTGGEMIVWGGDSGDGFLNTGGRYDPSTNSWVAIDTDAPSPRYAHTAIWTGTEMIVWGGGFFGGGSLTTLNTGGKYNPSSDRWVPTSSAGVPDPRQFHTAVWTGTEMIIWGGRSVDGAAIATLNTGGKYNPTSDSWVATSTLNAPYQRADHTAIWTGSGMVVWGGAFPNWSPIVMDTGGIYCSQTAPTPTPTPSPTATPMPPPTPTPTSTPIPGLPTVSAPVFTLDTQDGFAVSDQPVTTTLIQPSLNFIGFQADLLFDSAVAAPTPTRTAFVEPAGLTANGWNVSGNVLDTGPGTLKVLRVSAFVEDGLTPLRGEGTLFLIHWKRVSATSGETTQLSWRASPNDFEFIDQSLSVVSPPQIDGLITITSGGTIPTPTPTATPSVTPTPTPTSHLANISTRLTVRTGDNVLIGGFVISGSQPKRVIVRGLGPSLEGISALLADPVLELHQSNGTIITNDNWRDSQEAEIIASGLAPTNNAESAIIATLPPGAHTAIVRGKNGTTGVALVEVYDLDSNSTSVMSNVSTRGLTSINYIIAGTIILGEAPVTIIARGIGPSLSSSGIHNPLGDPWLSLHDENGAQFATNNDWRDTQQIEIQASGLAPTNNLESAILVNLLPGAYTAVLTGWNSGPDGVALVELFALP